MVFLQAKHERTVLELPAKVSLLIDPKVLQYIGVNDLSFVNRFVHEDLKQDVQDKHGLVALEAPGFQLENLDQSSNRRELQSVHLLKEALVFPNLVVGLLAH